MGWNDFAKALIKSELKRRGATYKVLANTLEASGTPMTEAKLANKIWRGTFSAAFFLQCLDAIGCRKLDVRKP